MEQQAFLRGNFAIWAGKGGRVEEVRNNFTSIILQGIQRSIPYRIVRKMQTLTITIRK
jgi:hypothetical protein